EVVTERVTYCDKVPLSIKDDHCISDDFDVIAKVIQQPNCLECKISKKGHKIVVETEREFIVKVIGETKVFVKVDPKRHHEFDSNDEDWDFDITDEELDEIKPNFLNRKEHS